MKLDDLLKVAADFPLPEIKKIYVDDDIFYLEQSPQLLSLLNPDQIFWKYNSIIIGPDGTQIETIGKENTSKYFYLSPINELQIGWDLKVNTNELVKLIYDILPCKEGESYFNPSFWNREDIFDGKKIFMESGEINEKLREKEHTLSFYENNLTLDTGYINPFYVYLNPFIINQSKELHGKSEFFSVSLKETFNIVGENKLKLINDKGLLKVETLGRIVVVKSKTWKEAKPYEVTWNLKNKVLKIDCKLPFPISLYKAYPSGIIPFFIKYDNNQLILGLVNLNDFPAIANLLLSARIEDAYILSPQGKEIEKLNPEFDRIKIPMRKFGIIYVKLKIKRLLESFLKRKIISS
ncbi:hypothetical protein SJAV_22620 [Sulfurisphaera javensis]|uniref:Uncharacterized protein n=1 Tax=Sulfurisphaera javensis TaxID=2049879 RepID=A0AAT9GUQ0_9CREN